MQISIQAQNFSLTKALRGHVERRVAAALNTRGGHIQQVMVRLFDINGPRGGEDKCCRIKIELPKLPDVVIENISANLYCAIDRAAYRAGRTVRKRLARMRDKCRINHGLDINKLKLELQ